MVNDFSLIRFQHGKKEAYDKNKAWQNSIKNYDGTTKTLKRKHFFMSGNIVIHVLKYKSGLNSIPQSKLYVALSIKKVYVQKINETKHEQHW